MSSFVGNGIGITASNSYASVVNGQSNVASGDKSFIGNGNKNVASTIFASILDGSGNTASGGYSTIINGFANTASGTRSIVLNGNNNSVSGINSAILNGNSNTISAPTSSILNGTNNAIDFFANFATIGNGQLNTNGSLYGSIGNGLNNEIIAGYQYSTISNGVDNVIQSNFGFVHGQGLLLNNLDYSTAFGRYNIDNTDTFIGDGNLGPIWAFGATRLDEARIFMIGNGTDNINRSNAMSVLQGGSVISSASGGFGAFIATGADYAEYMQSKYYDQSGNLAKIPYNYTVVLDDEGFVVPSNSPGMENKIVIGAISVNPIVVGNDNTDNEYQKYVRDETGKVVQEEYTIFEEEVEYEVVKVMEKSYYHDRDNNVMRVVTKEVDKKQIIYEEIDLRDESNNLIDKITMPKKKIVEKKSLRPKLDPNFDENSSNAMHRYYNPNYSLVGLLGQIIIRNDQRINPNWIRIRNYSEDKTIWLVR